MINFLLFILTGVGITNLVVNATILEGIRDYIGNKSYFLKKLLSCMMCSGFWVGIVISFLFNINPIAAAATISLLSNSMSYFFEYLDLTIALKAKELEEKTDQRDEHAD
jgi:hypothetical protein